MPPIVSPNPNIEIIRRSRSEEVMEPTEFGRLSHSHNFPVYPAWTTKRCRIGPVRVHAVTGCEIGGGGLIRQGDRILLLDDCFPIWIEPVLRGEWTSVAEPWLGAFLDEEARIIDFAHPLATILNPNLVYGHFLLEMLPRLHLLGVLRSLGIALSLLVPRQAPSWVLTFVLLYLRDEEIVWYDATEERVRAPLIVVPSMMHSGYSYDLHPAMSLMADDVKARVGVSPIKARPFRRLYLSRRRLRDPGWHRVLNEGEVEDTFAEHGFEILHPQDMTISEQLVAYDEAAVLAGEYGSAMHNALFCRSGVKVLVINEINKMQAKIAALRGQQLTVLAPADGKFRLWQTHVGDGEYTVDLVALKAALLDIQRS